MEKTRITEGRDASQILDDSVGGRTRTMVVDLLMRLLCVIPLSWVIACGDGQRPTPRAAPSTAPAIGEATPMTFEFEDFIASVDSALLSESMRESWSWLESVRDLQPVALTLAGDVFLIDRNNAVYFLDTNYGVIERVASSNEAFRTRMQDKEFALPILRMALIEELRSRNITAKHNECFTFALSPSIGGVVSADQSRPVNFQVHLDWLGQLTRGMKDLQVGQEFRIQFPDWPGNPPPSKGSVRKHPRDRPSFLAQ
ncbi:MAG: DUF1851 domain-containing protein [Kofleriaceae bacterium]|nr:DUF1851 domain-containing protein [Kofleriaceae bacterium]